MSAAKGAAARPPRLGVVAPCRNEAAVIGRKLANLARVRWPEGAAHRLVVVDDESSDGTAELARAAFERFGQLEARVSCALVPNPGPPGKAGAIRAGIEALSGSCDVLVLTDADVVLDEGALVALAEAFAREPSLGMACGAEQVVRSLADDGSARGADGGPLEPAPSAWDRLTAWVRRRESRRGRLFSVHGQLLAWRAPLGLAPGDEVAADDLDLMLRLRESRPELAIRMVPAARFFEVRSRRAPGAAAQSLRRARAYVQLFRAHPTPPKRNGLARRLQWSFYRHAPFALPWLAFALVVAAPFYALAFLGPIGALVAIVLLGLAARLPLVAEAASILATIVRAERMEELEPLAGRWEMERT